MKTTIEISNSIYSEIKKILVLKKTTLRALVEESLRKIIEIEKIQNQNFH